MSRSRIAVVTGADRGLGLGITKRLLELGWDVFAGSYLADWPELTELKQKEPERLHVIPLDVASDESVQAASWAVGDKTDRVDVLINNAGIATRYPRTIHEEQVEEELMRIYNVNAVGPMRMAKAFVPLLRAGAGKRMCFVSSEAGSINRSFRDNWYGYCMSKTALNRGVQCLYDELRPEGFTFRLYHPGWVRSYMSGELNTEGDLDADDAARMAMAYFLRDRYEGPGIQEEDRLVMRDWMGREWPW